MKTVSRMIFRYLLAAFGIAFLVLTVNGALLIGVVLHYGAKGQQEGFFPVGKFAESFTRTDDGFAPAPDMEAEAFCVGDAVGGRRQNPVVGKSAGGIEPRLHRPGGRGFFPVVSEGLPGDGLPQ